VKRGGIARRVCQIGRRNDEGALTLRGLVAKKEQSATLERLGRGLLDKDAVLKTVCSGPITGDFNVSGDQ